MIMILIIDKILILILIIIGLFDIDSHSQQQKRTKKNGQKMTDNQKSFGGSGLFKMEGPIYYMHPVCRVFLAWILHLLHQVLRILLVSDRQGSSLSFIKSFPPFSKSIRSLLLGFFYTCLTCTFLSVYSFTIPDSL